MQYILGSDSITVFIKGNSYTINKQSATYNTVLAAVKANDEQALFDAVNIKQTIHNKLAAVGSSTVTITEQGIFYGDRQINGLISTRIFDMLKLGLDVKPMVKFLENMLQNPSKRAVDELFGFLDACSLPITEDGYFLAYKRVRADYKDCHSGTMDNSVGKTVEMLRNEVDDNKEVTCSQGLHACSYDYLQHFGGERIVVVKIHPADVVSVPVDYNNAKLRCCKYKVVSEIPLNEYKMPERQLDQEYAVDFGYDYDYDEDEDETIDEESDVIPFDDETPVNPSAKLSEHEVRSIRKDYSTGQWTITELANFWGVSARQIGRIVRNESWKDVV